MEKKHYEISSYSFCFFAFRCTFFVCRTLLLMLLLGRFCTPALIFCKDTFFSRIIWYCRLLFLLLFIFLVFVCRYFYFTLFPLCEFALYLQHICCENRVRQLRLKIDFLSLAGAVFAVQPRWIFSFVAGAECLIFMVK